MDRVGALAALLLVGTAAACTRPDPVPRLQRADGDSGFRFRHELPGGRMDTLPKAAMGGFAVLDYDGDGRQDLYMVNGGWHPDFARAERPEKPAPNRLFRNLGGFRFEDVTIAAGVGDTGFGLGACVGDADGDGLPDLFVSNYGGSVLYRNAGDGTFEDWSARSGIAPGLHAGAAFVDYDRDGDLDLYVGQYVDPRQMHTDMRIHASAAAFPPPAAFLPQTGSLYRNDGNGVFEDVTLEAGVGKAGKAMSVVATDVDDDGWIDVFVANDTEPNFVWRNKGDGTFEDVAPVTGLAYGLSGSARASMGVDTADIDGDGRLDFLIPDTEGGCAYLARKTWFTDRAADLGLLALSRQWVGWADVPFDIDNDGDLDLYKAHGDLRSLDPQESFAVVAENDGGFVRAGVGGALQACARGAVATDLDDDGRLDVVVLALSDKAAIFANVTRDAGRWVRLRLRGTRSNRLALGARVTGRVGERTVVRDVQGSVGYISAGDLRVHFGLGGESEIRDVRVRWPTGEVQEFGDLAADEEHELVEN